MKTLTFEDIEAADDLKVEQVEIPEWGGAVYIREVSSRALIDYMDSLQSMNGNPLAPPVRDAAYLLIARSLVDESGKRIMTDDQAKVLENKKWDAITRLMQSIQRLNSMTDDAAEKKTDGTLDGNSLSDSRLPSE